MRKRWRSKDAVGPSNGRFLRCKSEKLAWLGTLCCLPGPAALLRLRTIISGQAQIKPSPLTAPAHSSPPAATCKWLPGKPHVTCSRSLNNTFVRSRRRRWRMSSGCCRSRRSCCSTNNSGDTSSACGSSRSRRRHRRRRQFRPRHYHRRHHRAHHRRPRRRPPQYHHQLQQPQPKSSSAASNWKSSGGLLIRSVPATVSRKPRSR
jgi:hypothetical protein